MLSRTCSSLTRTASAFGPPLPRGIGSFSRGSLSDVVEITRVVTVNGFPFVDLV